MTYFIKIIILHIVFVAFVLCAMFHTDSTSNVSYISEESVESEIQMESTEPVAPEEDLTGVGAHDTCTMLAANAIK